MLTGTHFNYYMVCRRKLWLFANGINMEHVSDLVFEGRLVHEDSYPQRAGKYEEIELNGIKVDFYDPKRKDNTLKFTPCVEDDAIPDVNAQSRYLPVEDISEFYVFFNMLKNLQYYNRRGKDMECIMEHIVQLAGLIPLAQTTEELMGVEGQIRRSYYEAFNLIIHDYEMSGRTKQPPENEINALISFGNMVCYTICLRAVHQTQLNPTIGYLHKPGERRYSLVLDISEIFKPIIVDRVIFKVMNRKEIQDRHFDRNLNSCLLNDTGKKIFVRALEDRLNETFKHRSLQRSVSYRHLVKLECYKLAKHLLEMEEYKPFKMYW